jgi:hypothetical protein
MGGGYGHATFADVENNAAITVANFNVFGGPDGVTRVLTAFGGQRIFWRHPR